jgi:hypothetical protein
MFSNKWRSATSNIGRARTFRCKLCSGSNCELGSHSASSSPLAVACDMFFSWPKPPIAVSLGVLFPMHFRLHGGSYAVSACASIRRRCCSNSHWDRKDYPLVSRSALLDFTNGLELCRHQTVRPASVINPRNKPARTPSATTLKAQMTTSHPTRRSCSFNVASAGISGNPRRP